MSVPATYLHQGHPQTGTTLVLHLGPGELLRLAEFMEQVPSEGRLAVTAGGISLMVEIPPVPLGQPGVMCSVKLKAGMVGGWTPEIIRVAGQVMPLYFPENSDG
jgi:hypothetical protein